MNSVREILSSKNKHDVYEAVFYCSGQSSHITVDFNGERGCDPTAKQIMCYINADRKRRQLVFDFRVPEIKLENVKPIKIRTVERCIKELIAEGRIEKIKTRYRISEKARYEIRYRAPQNFGDLMLRAAFKGFSRQKFDAKNYRFIKLDKPKIMNEFIKRFGALVIFAFIEAARPYNDQYFTIRERDELVIDWIKNSIPLQEMFEWFSAEFEPGSKSNRKPSNEIDNQHLMKISEVFKHAYPKIYKNLVEARKGLTEYRGREESHISYRHGKTYISNYGEYLLYLKQVNPLAYKSEIKRMQK